MKANQSARDQMGDEGAIGISDIILALLVVVIGLALVPTIQDSTNSSINALGATSAAGQLADLMPLFYVVMLVAGVVSFIYFKRD